ncbi:MAG: hypothetical protein KDC98_20970 [Planctomycetes bacterium]|nr:hypothetical protein [Planctomycetota bacterium]
MVPVFTADGDFAIDFARNARGKPESLRVSVADGMTVRVASENAAAVAPIDRVSDVGFDYRVVATVVAADPAVQVGLIARQRDPDNLYRFIWDRARSEFRLERRMGASSLVIGSSPGPAGDADPHRLAFQVEGFRLRAWLDDALVLQMLDGAHADGGWGTWCDDDAEVEWRDAAIEPVAPPTATSAITATDHAATLTVATTAAGGHFGVLELSLDRPHPAVPLSAADLEPWLLLRPASPRVLLGDFSGDLAAGAITELPPDGRMSCELHWPPGVALSGQVALARILVVSPDGGRLVSRTPAVGVVL